MTEIDPDLKVKDKEDLNVFTFGKLRFGVCPRIKDYFNSLSLKQLTPTKRRKQNRVHAIRKGCDGIRNSLKNRICPKRKKSNRLLRRRILNRIHSLSILGQIRRIYPIRESIGKNRL